jgi:ubiquinone/menaquinone biosynthesis C-methylase UbiE
VRSFKEVLKETGPELKEVVERIPRYQPHPRLHPEWLRSEIVERYLVLEHAGLVEGTNILEIGCGQGIATIPLALLIGESGRVVASDRGRWRNFWDLVRASGLQSRIIPIQEDARKLPFPYSCFDLVACVHGIRSFDNREAIVEGVKEMLRVAKERIFLAESSPIAKTEAQRAHLRMYDLRRPIFLAQGHEDFGDLHYFPPEDLKGIIEEAGAVKVDVKLVDVNMPHYLAYLPPKFIEKIEDERVREDLKTKWTEALEMLDKHGEEHPPVVVVNAWKRNS